ncbi:MAG: DUF1501 domain-containing protein, partial [Thermoleophilia bacterium]|nr:DUF1501 domain-containing protein [Thermoleophilia bacterium]
MKPDPGFPCGRVHRPLTRRTFLGRAGCGFGAVALAAMLDRESRARTGGVLTATHHPAKARSVIFLYM